VDGIGALGYAAAFVVPLILAWVLTPLALRLAVRLDVLDVPGDRKAQDSPIPYLGGVAIVVAFSATVLVAAALQGRGSEVGTLAILLGTGVLLALLGLVDDLRGVSVAFRLFVEIGAGVVVVVTGSGATITGSSALNAVATVAWVVLIVNAVNLLDNMDGLSAGVAAIASLAFFVLAVSRGQFLVAALSVALAGCAVGFLRHNFHPARIYMGDAGSLFLGFLLAVIATRIDLVATPPLVALFVPLLVLGVALFCSCCERSRSTTTAAGAGQWCAWCASTTRRAVQRSRPEAARGTAAACAGCLAPRQRGRLPVGKGPTR
jgi:UDP-GlcNAc:undecaprenyl-phosphate GlcNAc-1-phosphate transferase